MGHTDEVGIPICLSHFHSTRMQQSLLIYG